VSQKFAKRPHVNGYEEVYKPNKKILKQVYNENE